MKKNFSLFLILVFFIFSCAGTPEDKGADEPRSSQLKLTVGKNEVEEDAEVEVERDVEVEDETPPEQDMFAEGVVTDDSEFDENFETETDDFPAEAEFEEQQLIVEAVDEIPEEKTPSAPVVTAVQPPPVLPVITEEAIPVTDTPAEEQAVQEQTAQEQADIVEDENADEQRTVPPRSQPWLTLPPAVSAVKDDAPVPNRQGLIPHGDEIIFSRTVRATAGQIVEIPFRGTGWVYLGELASRRGLVYNSRRLDPDGQSFIFRAEEAGTYALKFYRQDFIRDYILNDYVQVIVGESSAGGGAGWFNPPIDRGRVTAEPRWPSALDESAMLRGSQGGAKTASGAGEGNTSEKESASSAAPVQQWGTTVVIPPAAPSVVVTPPATAPEIPQSVTEMPVEKQEKLPPEEILKKAQETFDEGNTVAAIALLDQFMEYYPDGSDELYWLFGQFYEANTPYRNILLSLDYYRRLINEYPQSRRYNDARRRIAYLERFYINIQ